MARAETPTGVVPTKEEVDHYFRGRSNWGRWVEKTELGAVNLITTEKRTDAARLVELGIAVSLSRPWPVKAATDNPRPAQHIVFTVDRPPGGAAMDYFGIAYHGFASTHIDALCHVWDEHGMWEGRDPKDVLAFNGARFGTVDAWKEGILTRGVLLDVPRYRGTPHVTVETPVHGWELEDIARRQGIELTPGDALIIYSGRESYESANGGSYATDTGHRPGLHASCLPFIRDHDVAVLVWDMIDAMPNEYGLPWPVHGVIFAYGVAVIDHCALAELAATCARLERYDFMLTANPLYVPGATGSPMNPVAIF